MIHFNYGKEKKVRSCYMWLADGGRKKFSKRLLTFEIRQAGSLLLHWGHSIDTWTLFCFLFNPEHFMDFDYRLFGVLKNILQGNCCILWIGFFFFIFFNYQYQFRRPFYFLKLCSIFVNSALDLFHVVIERPILKSEWNFYASSCRPSSCEL